jgi:hypothetical protein
MEKLYVNELLARLTEFLVRARGAYHIPSQPNDLGRFLARQPKYSTLSNLNLSTYTPGTWMTSYLTPFSAARLSKLQPLESNSYPTFPKSDIYVRVLVNDALRPLEFCGQIQMDHDR